MDTALIRLVRPMLCAGTLLLSGVTLAEPPAGRPAPAAPAPGKTPFDANVKVTSDRDDMIVESDGIPNHPHGDFPNADNPNPILKQHYRFLIPRHPRLAAKVTPTPFGPIGVAVNGIPFYNQYNGEGEDAVKLETFDSCCGHPDPQGRYHYHKYPVCLHSPFKDAKGKHSALIGYAFDGFPIYGPNGENGQPPKDLDSCNGHQDKVRGYHYHVTAGYPYILGGYHGVVEVKNFDHPDGPGGPDGFGPPFGPPPPFGPSPSFGPPPPFGPPP